MGIPLAEMGRNSGLGTATIAGAIRNKEQNEWFEYFEQRPLPSMRHSQNASIKMGWEYKQVRKENGR
jgi:hypothetical protein